MITHLHSDFLQTDDAYGRAEQFWIELWNKVDPLFRSIYGWRSPWFQPLPRELSEGNPIFSAVSDRLRRGIRVIQYEPTELGPEILAYPDTFGGPASDPSSISELVISCAISDVVETSAFELIQRWVSGEPIEFSLDRSGLLLPTSPKDWDILGSDLMSVAA